MWLKADEINFHIFSNKNIKQPKYRRGVQNPPSMESHLTGTGQWHPYAHNTMRINQYYQ